MGRREGRAGVVVRYVDRDVVGAPEQVANALRTAAARGRLVAVTAPRPAPQDPANVWVRARFLAPAPVRRSTGVVLLRAGRPVNVRRRRVAAVVGAAVVPAVGLAYLVWQVVQAVLAVLPVLAGALIVLFLLWRALRRSGVCCPGLHCSGCKH